MVARFELYKDKKGEFRWRLMASNGQMIANSGEGYTSKDSAKNGIESVKKNAPAAAVEDKSWLTSYSVRLYHEYKAGYRSLSRCLLCIA